MAFARKKTTPPATQIVVIVSVGLNYRFSTTLIASLTHYITF